MALTQQAVLKIKKEVEIDSLKLFFRQLRDVITIPTGENSDKVYKEYFMFVRKVELLIKRKEK